MPMPPNSDRQLCFLRLSSLSRQMFQAAIAKGYGEDDICGAIRVLEEFAQVDVESR
jgi:3-hydroxyisobutyrate dehydrogenase/2-hydroxy-3-oxopropionate reductase